MKETDYYWHALLAECDFNANAVYWCRVLHKTTDKPLTSLLTKTTREKFIYIYGQILYIIIYNCI